MAYLHEHFSEPIDREELAQHFAVNERHLTRCFHQEMGIPPIPYLNRYRVRRACALLEQRGMSITDIAWPPASPTAPTLHGSFSAKPASRPSAYRRGQRIAA